MCHFFFDKVIELVGLTHLFRAHILIWGGGLLSTGATLSSFHLLVELGLLLQLFAAYSWCEPDQLFIKRNHQTCLKQTKLLLDPILT